jgi:hypothetical protein
MHVHEVSRESDGWRWAAKERVFLALSFPMFWAGIFFIGNWVAGVASPLPLLFFHAAFALSVAAFLLRPRSIFMGALVTLLGLGFWLKFVFHAATGASWVEPIGSFGETIAEWDQVLLAGGAAMLATVVPTFLTQAPAFAPADMGTSASYRRAEPWLWAAFMMGGIALLAVNLPYSFYRVGLDVGLILPFPLNAVLSFLLSYGLAFGIGCLGYWSWSAGRLSPAALLAIGFVEAALCSASTLSRLRIVLHAAALVAGWLACRKHMPISRRATAGLAALYVALFVGSIAAVSYDRLVLYAAQPEPAAQPADEPVADVASPIPDRQEAGSVSPDTAEPPVQSPASPDVSAPAAPSPSRAAEVTVPDAAIMFDQVARLFIDRWIGLESVMAVVAYQGKGFDLFVQGVMEHPSVRNDGIYERISRSTYRALPGRTFLTMSGGPAILYYTGSVAIVFLGMTALCLIGIAIERLCLRLTASPFAAAVVAVAIAYAIVQVNQPYSSFVLAVELVAASLFTYGLRRAFVMMDRRLCRA